jgi:N-acetylneuraminic acid mutarotase
MLSPEWSRAIYYLGKAVSVPEQSWLDEVCSTVINGTRLLGMERIARMLVLASFLLLTVTNTSAQGRWIKLAPIPEASQESTCVAVNGKIYVFGGNPAGENKPPKGLVQEYDTAADKWTKKRNMPQPTHQAAAAEYHGKIYLFGGGAQPVANGPNQFPTNNAWEYDPAADSWKALAPMPTARLAAVAAEADGKIYVIGGASVHPGAKLISIGLGTPHRSLEVNEAYDPATNKWETHSPMPTARNHAAAGVVNGKIYVIGGRLGAANVMEGSNTDVVEQFDPEKDSWGAAGLRMPIARSGMGWATYQNRIYVAGGEIMDAHMFATIRAVEAYDPATNQWSSLPVMPTARHGVNVAAIGNRLYVIGGHLQGGAIGGEAANTDVNEVFEFSEK